MLFLPSRYNQMAAASDRSFSNLLEFVDYRNVYMIFLASYLCTWANPFYGIVIS